MTTIRRITTRIGSVSGHAVVSWWAGLALSCSLAIGCVATASPPPARGLVVSGPPPPPIAETRSAPPTADATWVPGYWHWIGAQYAWIPGHWESAPPGANWYGPRYVTTEGRHYYEPGQWQNGRSGVPANANALR